MIDIGFVRCIESAALEVPTLSMLPRRMKWRIHARRVPSAESR